MEVGMGDIERLRRAVEQKADRQMTVHGDYEYLSGLIFDTLHLQISPTTLKRLWGKLDEAVVPRRSTLDILAQFVGEKDWADFQNKRCSDIPAEQPLEQLVTDEETPAAPKKKGRVWPAVVGCLGVALLAVVVWLFYPRGSAAETDDDRYILRKGQTFDSYADYLRLFGITSDFRAWGQQVPHYPYLHLWGPQYNHPEWHNAGNPDSLMPTIAEYWVPINIQGNEQAQKVVQHMNSDAYYVALRLNEVRLTFMKGLPSDSAHFVFLGVYRMSLSLSDTTQIVWERVADEVDLHHLDYLEQFRN